MHDSLPMSTERSPGQQLVLNLASAWGRLQGLLDHQLSAVRGISFAEYRILRVLADDPRGHCSRVDLAAAVGLTPSGVTRALRPLERIRVVTTERSERDARLALASLTPAGRELVENTSAVIDDVMGTVLRRVSSETPTLADLVGELTAV
jgi:DNA-binding MarR family transcriptional regulator